MAAHAKTAPISSLVAVYWRVEEEVDRPVAGSTFMLEVMITAEKYRIKNKSTRRFHISAISNLLRSALVQPDDNVVSNRAK